MAGELLVANNVTFSIGDAGTTEAFTVIPGIIGLPTIPANIAGDLDVTSIDSAAMEYIITLADAGTMEFDLNIRRPASGSGYLAAQQTLAGYANDGVARGWRVLVKNGATTLVTISGKCFVKSFQEQAASANAAITAKVMLRITGAVTRA